MHHKTLNDTFFKFYFIFQNKGMILQLLVDIILQKLMKKNVTFLFLKILFSKFNLLDKVLLPKKKKLLKLSF